MFRLALTIYLTLATLAGQWLCCCSVHRLSDLLCQHTKQDGELPQTISGKCCGHRHTSATHDSQAEPTPSSPAKPDGPACPCQEQRTEMIAGLGIVPDTAKQLRTAQTAVDSFVFVSTLIPAGELDHVSGIRQSRIPFRTVHDVLSSLKTLRC